MIIAIDYARKKTLAVKTPDELFRIEKDKISNWLNKMSKNQDLNIYIEASTPAKFLDEISKFGQVRLLIPADDIVPLRQEKYGKKKITSQDGDLIDAELIYELASQNPEIGKKYIVKPKEWVDTIKKFKQFSSLEKLVVQMLQAKKDIVELVGEQDLSSIDVGIKTCEKAKRRLIKNIIESKPEIKRIVEIDGIGDKLAVKIAMVCRPFKQFSNLKEQYLTFNGKTKAYRERGLQKAGRQLGIWYQAGESMLKRKNGYYGFYVGKKADFQNELPDEKPYVWHNKAMNRMTTKLALDIYNIAKDIEWR